MHADRTNRFVLGLFGLLVLAAGTAAMIASFGGFGRGFARRALFDNRFSTYIGEHGTWVWAAAAFVCLLIALAGLRWILVLLISTDRAGDLTVPGSKDQGTTKLPPAALTGALAGEIESYHGVDAARGRVIGSEDEPRIVIAVTASQSADLAALHRRTEAEALAHTRQALGRPGLPIQLDLDVSRRS
jgi:hypothetical protein